MDANRLRGVLPPVPTFFSHDKIDHGHLSAHIERLARENLTGFVILGSNGEAALLEELEKRAVFKTARAAIPDNRLMIAGTGLPGTGSTKRLIEMAADEGADAALVLPPYFYKVDANGLMRHYVHLAEASSLPILLYNMPKYTGVALPVGVIRDLAKHPNIIGIKDSAGDLGQLAEIDAVTPGDFVVLAGSDKIFFAGLMHGLRGAILALANLLPGACAGVYAAMQSQQWEIAQALALKLMPVGRLVISTYGVPGLKAGLDILGFKGGSVRMPLLSLGASEREKIRKVFIENGFDVPGAEV